LSGELGRQFWNQSTEVALLAACGVELATSRKYARAAALEGSIGKREEVVEES